MTSRWKPSRGLAVVDLWHCAPKRMPFSPFSRCVTSIRLLPRFTFDLPHTASPLTATLALEWITGIVSAKDVLHRRPRRYCDWRPDIGCVSPQVRTTLLHSRYQGHRRALFPPFSSFRAVSNFIRQQAVGFSMMFNYPATVNRFVSGIANCASCLASPSPSTPCGEADAPHQMLR